MFILERRRASAGLRHKNELESLVSSLSSAAVHKVGRSLAQLFTAMVACCDGAVLSNGGNF
jgi:hypothetical protein